MDSSSAEVLDKQTNFRVLSQRTLHNNRFKIDSLEITIKLNESNVDNRQSIEDIVAWYDTCFTDILNYFRDELKIRPRDFIGIKITIPTMENTKPIGIYYREMMTLSGEIISDKIGSIMQSNMHFSEIDEIEIVTTIVRNETAGGRSGSGGRLCIERCAGNIKYILKHKRSVLVMPDEEKLINSDMFCLPRAIIIGRLFADNQYDKKK